MSSSPSSTATARPAAATSSRGARTARARRRACRADRGAAADCTRGRSMTFLSGDQGRRNMGVMSVKDRDKPLEALDQRLEELRELTRSLEKARDAIVGLRHEDAHTAVRDVAERYNISDEALIAFVENAGELLNGKELSVADARRAGMLAAAGAAWENELGPLLTSAQVRELLGNVSR